MWVFGGELWVLGGWEWGVGGGVLVGGGWVCEVVEFGFWESKEGGVC